MNYIIIWKDLTNTRRRKKTRLSVQESLKRHFIEKLHRSLFVTATEQKEKKTQRSVVSSV